MSATAVAQVNHVAAGQAAPFGLNELTGHTSSTAATIYTEADRGRDRELCQRYFGAWTRSFGNLDAAEPGYPGITFAEFQLAAERLAASPN